jgi:ssDNA-binding Zn-finger/Zn-ribbon topoisomerase 1
MTKAPDGEDIPDEKSEFEFPVCPICKKPMQLARIEPNKFHAAVPQIRIFECTQCGRSITITA